MKRYEVTLQSQIIRGALEKPITIEAQDMAEAVCIAADQAKEDYRLAGWESMTIKIQEVSE